MVNKEDLVNRLFEGYKRYLKHPIRNTLATAVLGLSALTMVKDNVHFMPAGVINFHSPDKNQYTWGGFVLTRLNGQSTANIRTYGLMAGLNRVGDNSTVGNMSAYGLIAGLNGVGDNSTVGNMSTYGLIGGLNEVGDNSTVGNMSAYAIVAAGNSVGNLTRILGDVESRGFISSTPSGTSPLSRIDKYQNYTHSVDDNLEEDSQ